VCFSVAIASEKGLILGGSEVSTAITHLSTTQNPPYLNRKHISGLWL
jgi:hypothetical protein